jgi:lysophospholipase L1-like esterase
MPSKLDIAVSSVPDGTYKTILTNPADDSIVFAADVDYVSGIATTGSITPDVGTALTGFVIDNQVTPLNGSVIYGVTNVLAGVSTRYFNTLDPIQTSHYTIANPIAFAGDFEIEVEFVTSKTGVEQHLLDSSADILCKMTLSATGLAKFLVGDGSIWAVNITGTTNLSDGRLHTVKCSKVGNFYNIIVDGNQEATRTSATPVTPSITQVGRRANGTNYFDGIIANVKFTDLETQSDINGLASQRSTYGDLTPTQSSSIAAFTLSSVDAPSLTGTVVDRNDANITYWGGRVAASGVSYPKTLFNTLNTLSYSGAEEGAASGGIEFSTDASKFEMRFYKTRQAIRILVDGVFAGTYDNTVSSGQLRYLLIDLTPLGLSGTHRIRLEFGGGAFIGDLVLDSGATLSSSPALGETICYLGDSFTEGTGVTYETASNSYVGVSAKQLGFNDYATSGFGGTGWLKTNYPGFGSIRPALITRAQWDAVGYDNYVIAMGINDTDADITASINTTLDTIQAANIGKPIFVLGSWGNGDGGNIKPLIESSIVSATTGRSHVHYIQVYQVSFTKSDATHPDEAGHKTLGDYIAQQIKAISATTTFALDTPVGDIEYSEENVFGSELWSDPATSIGNAWVYDGGGVYSRSSPTVGSDISISATTVAQGTPILITVTIDVFTRSGLVVRYQGGDNVSIPNSVGTHSVVAIAGAVGTTRVRGDSSFEGTISNISVKEISNAVQYIGIPDINEATPAREEFTLVDGDWLGSELSEVSLYNVTAGLSQIIDNTTLRILTDSGGAFTAVTAFGFSDANSYILTFTATNSGGALNITDGNGVVTYFSSTASGDFEVVIPPNGLRFKRGFGGVLNDILVTNISIKRILEVAEQPVQTATLEINDSVIFVGDSMTYAGNGAPHAYWQWLQQAQNGALYVPIDGNQGISGETTAEIAARVQSYPSTPSTVIILMGENDANGVSLASMQANFESIFTKFSTSKIVYVMPQAFTQSISGSPFKQGRRDDLNLWLSTISNTYPNVNYISNAWDGITIYDGGVGADSYDGVHMNPSGAAKLGGNVATHISSDLASGTAYDAPLYDGNNLITTTSLSGVGGSKSNSSGDVADGWALTNGSGATVVASKGTQDGSSQIIEITGTASSGSAIRLRDSIGALNIPIGDVVEGFANIKITATDGSSAPVGIEGFGYELAYNKVTWLSQYYSGAQGSFDLSGATSGVIRAYPKEIDANISTLTVDFALQPTVGAVDIRIEVSKPTAYFGLT